jgi:xanthine dehydrogenase YagS FAD-binding subunit
MRTFTHFDAYSMDEACTLLERYAGRAKIHAGGTDLLSVLKGDILPDYPEAVINIKTIPGLDYIQEDDDFLKIGAFTRLANLARSEVLQKKYRVLTQAALSIGSPQIRNVASIGGNLCQDTRCWYYRYPRHLGGPMQCLRKGNGPCLAIKGDNRYHALFNAKKCCAVCPSDMAVALTSLNAKLNIVSSNGERHMAIENFYTPLGNGLKTGEMVREIIIPRNRSDMRQTYLKFTLRKPIDFAIVSVACVMTVKKKTCHDAGIVLGAVAPIPYRAKAAEEMLSGRSISKNLAIQAAEKALENAKPLSMNAYKIQIAKTLIKRVIEDLGGVVD